MTPPANKNIINLIAGFKIETESKKSRLIDLARDTKSATHRLKNADNLVSYPHEFVYKSTRILNSQQD